MNQTKLNSTVICQLIAGPGPSSLLRLYLEPDHRSSIHFTSQSEQSEIGGQIFETFLRYFPKIFLCQMIQKFQKSFPNFRQLSLRFQRTSYFLIFLN